LTFPVKLAGERLLKAIVWAISEEEVVDTTQV